MLLKTNTNAKRPGMILLIVVAFLSMFLVVGTTYLLLADSIRKTSDFDLNATDKRSDFALMPDIDPRYMFNFALGQILYDVADPVIVGTKIVNTNSALRGHSLATNIYGSYLSNNFNDKAFSGTGKLNRDLIIAGSTIKEWQMVNYSFGNAFNPERLNGGTLTLKTSTWNAPYTYPDHNNFYLGWLKSDGSKVIPSFHRDYIFGSMAAPFANPNWTNAIGKYLTPRPRPNEHPNFPYPEADGMDVKNLEGYPGGNDSIWIDAGFPVMTTLDGRKYKALIAPLILDLDGRINVNVAGNVMGAGNSHASNQGWGPWEINLSTALGTVALPAIAQNVKIGDIVNNSVLPGVYGLSKIPGGVTLPTPNPTSPWGTNAPTPHPYLTPSYSMIDFNAKSEIGANAPISFLNSYSSFPAFSGNYTSDVVTNEIGIDGSHPSFVNPQRIKIGNSKFNNNELASLLRWSGRSNSAFEATLVKILQTPLGADKIYDNSTIATRNRLTTLSADIQQPTLLPYFYDKVGKPYSYLKYPENDVVNNPNALPYPLGIPLAFANIGVDINVGSKSDFPIDLTNNKISGVASINGYINQINLNRNLTEYPQVNPAFTGVGGSGGRYINRTGYTNAVSDRQKFALDIFNTLLKVTGAKDMTLSTIPLQGIGATDPDYEANRYLAQLAVNIVDYIDNDDVMTEFIWKRDPAVPTDPTKHERVYGVELNKVILNEVYAEIINDPTDTFPEKPPTSMKFPASKDKPFQVHFWVELMNPLPAPPVAGSLVNHAILEQDPMAAAGDSSVYQLEIRDQSAVDDIFKPDNPLGLTRPDMGGNNRSKGLVSNFQPAGGGASLSLLAPSSKNYLGTENAANGFIVIGSNVAFPNSGPVYDATDPAKNEIPKPYTNINNIANIKKDELKYTIPIVQPAGTPDPAYDKANFATTLQNNNKPSIVLRRLANPYLAPQTDATKPDYNPYVTVDVINDIKINDGVTNATDDKKVAPPPIENRSSVVRQQPYQESGKKNVGGIFDVSTNMAKPLVKQPQHTFLRQNGTKSEDPGAPYLADPLLKLSFSLINHLDRKLVNPLEILGVSGCKPAEVTYRFANLKFIDGKGNKMENKAPWYDEASNLYRFLALADVQGWQQGTAFAGRQIGKVNINNIWDREVFSALCDANVNNNFTQGEVDTIFNNFIAARSPSPGNSPAFGDSPFWGFGVGKSAGSDDWTSAPRGIDNSLLRGAGTGTALFDLPVANGGGGIRDSNQQKELLSKIANNITTKSNVFAVWITTGYFEVTDETTQPPTLGAEIGKADGINIRHRMFAIVDRTNMVNAQLKNVALPVPTSPFQNYDFGVPGALILKSVVPPYANVPSYDGMLLTIEPNTDNEETISLRLYNNPANAADPLNGHLVGDFFKTHPRVGFTQVDIINRGNPGPWVGYDRTKDREVVPYAEIIE